MNVSLLDHKDLLINNLYIGAFVVVQRSRALSCFLQQFAHSKMFLPKYSNIPSIALLTLLSPYTVFSEKQLLEDKAPCRMKASMILDYEEWCNEVG